MAMLNDQVASAAASAGSSLANGFPTKPRHAEAVQPGGSRSLRDVCIDMRGKLDSFLSEEPQSPLLRNVQAQLRTSMAVVDEALDTYPLERMSISYNGGKDCLVLLIMILAGLARRLKPKDESEDTFKAVYIVSRHPFTEVDDFVASSSAEYHLDVMRYALPMKAGLEAYLADRPSIEAIFVGTRRTDPHGDKLTHFDRTDAGWPNFMRVHPVIDWHYAEIWAFIRHLNIPYCPLYDQGYTSLGGATDTHPNPHLKRTDDNQGFRPAYELTEDDEERLGRDR